MDPEKRQQFQLKTHVKPYTQVETLLKVCPQKISKHVFFFLNLTLNLAILQEIGLETSVILSKYFFSVSENFL